MLKYLVKQSKLLLVGASVASIAHGTASVLLLTQINAAMTAPQIGY